MTSLEVSEDAERGLQAVHMRIGPHLLHLAAGEVYEEPDGTLRVQWTGDESALAWVSAGN